MPPPACRQAAAAISTPRAVPEKVTAGALAAARGRLLALKARFDAGTLAPSDYELERRAVEREIGDALTAGATGTAAERPPPRLVAAVAAIVVVVAVAGYARFGSPSLAVIRAAAPSASPDLAAAAPDAAASGGTASADSRQAGLGSAVRPEW